MPRLAASTTSVMIGREGGDGAAAQVVAVAEAAGQHEGVDALEVVLAVPEGDGLGAGEAHGAQGVAVVERAGEGDDADAHQASTSAAVVDAHHVFDHRVGEDVVRDLLRPSASAASSSIGPSTVSSKRLPTRTPRELGRWPVPGEGAGDGLALRVEQLGLGHDFDNDGGHL